MHSQVIRLFACFLTYILLIFIFAGIYYHLMFKRERKHFIFQRQILLGRKEEVEDLIGDLIGHLEPEIEVLQHIIREFEQGKEIKDITAERTTVNLQSGRKYEISGRLASDVDFNTGVVARDYMTIEVLILSSQGRIIGRMSFEDTDHDSFKGYLAYRQRRLNLCKEQLETIEDNALDVWSYRDFCYFSVSTQTTLGSGDILPNSTLARTVVTIQVFSGLAILVLAINYVIMLSGH